MDLFTTLLAVEPRLAALLREAAHAAPDDPAAPWCATAAWPAYKARLTRLVGWYTPMDASPLLATAAAYEAAYQRVLAALPPCRGCGCGEAEEVRDAA